MYIVAELVERPVSIVWYVNTQQLLYHVRQQPVVLSDISGEELMERYVTSDRTNGVNTSTLTISPVTEQDEDEYYCVASLNETILSDVYIE